MKSGVIGGVIGSLMGVLLGAAAFRAGTPVDARFTYQGQIRDGEALVSGNVDIRFTLWDSADGGTTVGSAVTKTNLPVTDGRFATELDFGASVFSGDARWIQMEVRSPAGTGQYLALPRQRVNAVPYALYSLNGGLSPWNLDVATHDIGYVNGRVGIGTNSPSAELEVFSPGGGDDSVKLPTGAIGKNELAKDTGTTALEARFVLPGLLTQQRSFSVERDCYAVLIVTGTANGYSAARLSMDGYPIGLGSEGTMAKLYSGANLMPLSRGPHIIQMTCDQNCQSLDVRVTVVLIDQVVAP